MYDKRFFASVAWATPVDAVLERRVIVGVFFINVFLKSLTPGANPVDDSDALPSGHPDVFCKEKGG